MSSFNTSTDIPDLSGKVIFITGGNTGLGKETALQLSKHSPSQIFVTSRSKERGLSAIVDIRLTVPNAKLTLIQMDLSSLNSVHAAAKQFLTLSTRLDILINNAGIMAVPPSLTSDGYEIQFGTNTLGHALLTKLLLPVLLKTAKEPDSDVRIVTLSSDSHHRALGEGIQFDKLKDASYPPTAFQRYGQSKLANILCSKELARRYPTITSVVVHPGVVHTGLTNTMKRSFLLAKILVPVVSYFRGVSVEEGVRNQLWAATGEGVESGTFYYPVGKREEGSERVRDMVLAGKLWEWTEGELGKGEWKV